MTGESVSDGGARVRNKWGQGDRLRAEILAAAGELLGELGTVEGLTLRGVARRAGIAPASVYTQFADRAALIGALLGHEHGKMAELMRRAGESADPGDPAARIRAELRAFCRYCLDSPGLYRIMFGPRPGPGDVPSAFMALEQLTATVAAAEAAGARLRIPAERAAIVLLVGAHGRVAIHHARPGRSTEEGVSRFADELLGLVLDLVPFAHFIHHM